MRQYRKAMEIRRKLNRIKREILAERVSYGELAFIQDHRQEILEIGDILLAQWAGIDENEFNGIRKGN